MRPGYLQGYGEDRTKPGNLGYASAQNDEIYLLNRAALPSEFETGYIPEYMRYSKIFPNYPVISDRPFVRPRDPRTFNVLMI